MHMVELAIFGNKVASEPKIDLQISNTGGSKVS